MNLTLPTGASTPLPAPSFSFRWDDKGEVHTRKGTRHLFASPAPDGWWDYWKAHKDELKKQGFSCGKDDSGEWKVTCWLMPASGASKADFSKILLEMSRAERAGPMFSSEFPEGVTPYGYQEAGVEYALRRERVIIGDDMGLGKTLQAIGVCNKLKSEHVLVVCPASLRLNWADEWDSFSVRAGKSREVAILSKKDIPLIEKAKVVFISYNLMCEPSAQRLLRARKWDVVIADEAHFLKNKTTQRAVRLLGLPPRAKSKLKDAPREPIPADRYLLLTGTPVGKSPADFWNILRFCAPEHFGVWTKYANRYCNARRVPYGSGWDTSGHSNLDELQAIARGSCMVRRLKSQVLKQLPPKTRKIVALPTPEETIRELDALTMTYKTSQSTVAKLRKQAEEAKTAGNAEELQGVVERLQAAQSAAFSETSVVRKAIGLAKADLAVDHIENVLSDTESKVIVGAHHKEVVKQLVARLSKHGCVVVTGETDPTKRHGAVKEFQTDPRCRLFIGNVLAAGTGLTLTAAPHVVIVEPDWNPDNNTQFEDRAHRIGQAQPVLIEYLAMERTIDIQILRSNAKKMDIADQAVNRESSLQLIPEAINYGPKGPAEETLSREERLSDEKQKRERRMLAIAFGQSMSPRELIAAHQCVKKVAMMDDDHATAVNGVGFNKMDSQYGGQLARKKMQDLTDFEKGRCASLAWKYRRQCPEDLTQQLKDPRKKPTP